MQTIKTLTNFGRNLRLKPRHFYTPKTEREVLDIMARHSDDVIRCVGRLHSWSNILDSPHVLLDLKHLRTIRTGTDDTGNYAHVGAGCQIKHLITELNISRQWTLPSVGFITEQTIAGAISTGTHGSGRHSLSHYVKSVRLARYAVESGNPEIIEINSGDELRAARCSLGSLGVILSVKLEVRNMYHVEEQFCHYRNIEDVLNAETQFPLQQFYLVPWKWTYVAQQRRETERQSSILAPLYHQYRFWVFDVCMHLFLLCVTRIPYQSACIRFAFKRIIPALVIPNWKVVADSSSQLVMEHELFHHIEMELFVQRSQLPDAINFVTKTLQLMAEKPDRMSVATEHEALSPFEHLKGKYCHHYPICIRKILCDDTLLSMSCRFETNPHPSESWYSITLTNLHRGKNREAFMKMVPVMTTELAYRFNARTHWGKLFGMSPAQIQALYPQLPTFLDLRERFDPEARFMSPWLKICFGYDDTSAPYT